MKSLLRTAVLFAAALLLIQPVPRFATRALAAPVPAAASKLRKRKRHKQKEIILKGRHGKHARRPA